MILGWVIVMLYNFAFFIIVFFFYSFIGYLIEITSVSLKEDKLVFSRGYLIGPYIPIFGFGAIFMVYYLNKYQEDLLTLFILGVVSCCILEYFTSLLMEYIFHLRWWDYSDRKFNINGRVCLENGIFFGLGGILLVKYIHPWLLNVLYSFSYYWIIVLGSILFIILLVDFLISTSMILQLKIDVDSYINKDATEVLKKELKKRLEVHAILRKRILRAFPKIIDYSGMKQLQEILDNNKRRR